MLPQVLAVLPQQQSGHMLPCWLLLPCTNSDAVDAQYFAVYFCWNVESKVHTAALCSCMGLLLPRPLREGKSFRSIAALDPVERALNSTEITTSSIGPVLVTVVMANRPGSSSVCSISGQEVLTSTLHFWRLTCLVL